MASSPLRQEIIFSSSDSESTNDTSDSERSPPRPEIMKVKTSIPERSRESSKTTFLRRNSFVDDDILDERNFFENDPHPAAKPTFSEEDVRWARSLESAVWSILASEKHQIEACLTFKNHAISAIVPKYPPGVFTHNRIAEQTGGVDELLVEAKGKITDFTTQLKILLQNLESHLDRIEAVERGMEKLQAEYETDRMLNRPSLVWQRLEGLEEYGT